MDLSELIESLIALRKRIGSDASVLIGTDSNSGTITVAAIDTIAVNNNSVILLNTINDSKYLH